MTHDHWVSILYISNMLNQSLDSLTLISTRRPTSPGNAVIKMLLLVVVLYVLIPPGDARRCGSCMNGGIIRLSNSIFGVCQCMCPFAYKGPACQFSRRSGRGVLARSKRVGEILYENWTKDVLKSRRMDDAVVFLGLLA